MNDSKKQKSSHNALVGVVVKIPFTTEHDLDTLEAVEDSANSPLAKDVVSMLVAAVQAYCYDNGIELDAYQSRVVQEVTGDWRKI